jgi:hypothetical protein
MPSIWLSNILKSQIRLVYLTTDSRTAACVLKGYATYCKEDLQILDIYLRYNKIGVQRWQALGYTCMQKIQNSLNISRLYGNISWLTVAVERPYSYPGSLCHRVIWQGSAMMCRIAYISWSHKNNLGTPYWFRDTNGDETGNRYDIWALYLRAYCRCTEAVRFLSLMLWPYTLNGTCNNVEISTFRQLADMIIIYIILTEGELSWNVITPDLGQA